MVSHSARSIPVTSLSGKNLGRYMRNAASSTDDQDTEKQPPSFPHDLPKGCEGFLASSLGGFGEETGRAVTERTMQAPRSSPPSELTKGKVIGLVEITMEPPLRTFSAASDIEDQDGVLQRCGLQNDHECFT